MAFQKGLLLWTFMIIFLTLIAIYFYITNVLGSVSMSVKTAAALQSDKITAVINVLQASPPVTCNEYFLPEIDCTIKIDSLRVNFTDNANKISAITYYIQTPAKVNLGSNNLIELGCSAAESKIIRMARCGSEIIISDGTITCNTVTGTIIC